LLQVAFRLILIVRVSFDPLKSTQCILYTFHKGIAHEVKTKIDRIQVQFVLILLTATGRDKVQYKLTSFETQAILCKVQILYFGSKEN
jgi:hypothetical protein